MKNSPVKLIIAIIVALVVIAGAWIMFMQPAQTTTPAPNNTQITPVVCNSPYIQVGNNCCLDSNSNSICDSDEQTNTQPVQNTTTPPVDIPVVSQSGLPEDKEGQPQLVLTYIGKALDQNTTTELAGVIQKGDSIIVEVSDSRYATPLALATVTISNDLTQKVTTDVTGTATIKITQSGNTNLTAYKEKFNKSNPYPIGAYSNYAAGKIYSLNATNTKIATLSKWTAWQHEDSKGQFSITLKDNQKGDEVEISSRGSNYQNPTFHDSYLVFENTTGQNTKLGIYDFDEKEFKALANKSLANYAPTMHKEQAAIVISDTNDRNCLNDSKIAIVDTYQSPQQVKINKPNQFSLLWQNDYLYYADFSKVQKCNYNALETIPVYKTNTGNLDPIKIFEVKKPTYYQLKALDNIYFADPTGLTFISENEQGGTSIHYYDFQTQSNQVIIDDGREVVERTLPQTSEKYIVWTQKARDGKWHVMIYNKATGEQKLATWNSKDQTELRAQFNTLYYVEDNQLHVLDIKNE